MPTHNLSTPVKLANGTELTGIPIDEPSLAGLAQYEMSLAQTGSSIAALIALISVETKHPIDVIGRIKGSDLEGLTNLILPFVPGGTNGETGDPSPPTSPSS